MVDATTASVVIAFLFAVGVVGSYLLGWYSWRRIDHPVSNRFAWVMIADGTWALFALAEYLSPTDRLAQSVMPVVSTVAAFAAVFWLLFVVEYTDNTDRLPTVVTRLLLAEPLVYGGLMVLNPASLVYTDPGVARYGILRLPYQTYGPVFLGQILFTYLLLLVSFVLLGRFFLRTRNLYRKQTGVIFSVTLLIVLANMFYVAGFSPHPHLDLTPVFFVLQALAVSFSLYRYDFLDVAPLAAHTLFEDIADPVFVVDNEDRVVDYNEMAATYVTSVDKPRLSDVSIPELESVLTPADGGDVATGTELTATQQVEGQSVSVTYDVRTTPITDRYDITRGYAVVLRDITERKRNQQRLKRQNERLEEFTGIVSHDLRNPLQVAKGRVEAASATGDTSHLEQATDAIERMESMIETLLELAQEGQTIDEKRPVALADSARAAWDTVDTGDATLVVESGSTVDADPQRLRQVFENLFRNAVEHGPDTVTVTVSDFEDGFAVADDGPGIPEEHREDLFELGVTYSDDGTGFGLGIVAGIIDAHGWTISVSESESGGARFEITTTV